MFFYDKFVVSNRGMPKHEIYIVYTEKGLAYVGVDEFKPPSFVPPKVSLISLIHPVFRKQIEEYFHGERKHFEVNYDIRTTPFCHKVYQELLSIPYGEVRTYKEIATNLGMPKGQRAVGQALKTNPVPILIPCHRVVAKSGLGGFSLGIELKKQLLTLEQ